ncbi:hypothetical protein AB0C29_01135 [Actinoplanes sp. NPDC048791]|uniref:hypothetical protein n=1 Tax=Actinoplanes sp. NPDC048791 TaxID=3154623 RepID=UPI00340B2C3C
MSRIRTKTQVLAVMRRLGLADKISEAEALLPDVVDLDRDAALFAAWGIDLDVDALMDRLGGGP